MARNLEQNDDVQFRSLGGGEVEGYRLASWIGNRDSRNEYDRKLFSVIARSSEGLKPPFRFFGQIDYGRFAFWFEDKCSCPSPDDSNGDRFLGQICDHSQMSLTALPGSAAVVRLSNSPNVRPHDKGLICVVDLKYRVIVGLTDFLSLEDRTVQEFLALYGLLVVDPD